jgi:hypothetical protein
MLDSGAQMSTVSQPLAASLGLRPAGSFHLAGVTGSQQGALASGVEIQLGTLRLSNLTVLVTDLREVEADLGRSMPFVLGRELFNSAVVEIDYPAARLILHDPARYQPGPEARRLALEPGDGGEKLVRAAVEGLPPALFALDTGDSGAVTLFGAYVKAHALLKDRPRRGESVISGVGGAAPAIDATLKSLTLGELELRDLPAAFATASDGAFATGRIAGQLGAGVLARFRVTFDHGRSALYLVPSRPATPSRPGQGAAAAPHR